MMPERLMDIDYLLQTEKGVKEQTLREWGVGSDTLTQVIDLFFSVSHFLNEECEIESEENAFQVIAYSSYIRLPYTLKSVKDLWLSGYYLECYIIIRHIVEGFAKLRYFTENRNQIINHYTAKRPRDRISFRTMFDAVAPGFYEMHYGRILSGFSHGDLNALSTRIEYFSPTEGRVIVGCEFNDTYSGLIINLLLTFSYGYLNYLDTFFPTIMERMRPDVLSNYRSIKLDLTRVMNNERQTPDQQEGWENVVRPFVE